MWPHLWRGDEVRILGDYVLIGITAAAVRQYLGTLQHLLDKLDTTEYFSVKCLKYSRIKGVIKNVEE